MADNRYRRDDDWRGRNEPDPRRGSAYDRGDRDDYDGSYGERRGGMHGADRDYGGEGAGNDWGRGGYSRERDAERGGMAGEGRGSDEGGYGGMRGEGEDRGWMSRAADAVGAWVGGGDDRDRGYGGMGGQSGYGQGSYAGSSQSGFGQGGTAGGQQRGGMWAGPDYGQGGLMGGGYAGSQWGTGVGAPQPGGLGGFGQPHRDEHYHSLRERHLQDLDRQYEEFRRHRQDRFQAEFDEWRRNRGGAGSSSYEQANNPSQSPQGASTGGPPATVGTTGASTTLTGTADPNRAADMMKDADKSTRK